MTVHIHFSKAANPGKRKLGTGRLTQTEKIISQNFGAAIGELTANVNTQALTQALAGRNVGAAILAYDWGQFAARMSGNRLAMLTQLNQTGLAEARAVGSIIGHYAFDVTDPRATAWAAARSGERIVQVSTGLQAEIRGMITNSFVNQIDPRQIAKELELKVGLFDRWASAVDNQYQRNYTGFLNSGMSAADAERKATVLAESYRDRLIKARCDNIARTEVMTAANEGRSISWLQAGDAGLVDLATAGKEWIAEGDACDECQDVNEEIVPVMESFSNGEDMPPGHPSCRCTAVLIPDAEFT